VYNLEEILAVCWKSLYSLKIPLKISPCWLIYPRVSEDVEFLLSLSNEVWFAFLSMMVTAVEAAVECSRAEKEVSRLMDLVDGELPAADESFGYRG